MPNMSLKKNEMPVQDPNVRNKNFKEVALGYTEEQAALPQEALPERLPGFHQHSGIHRKDQGARF